ncbi:hypothetical protein CXB51_006649 [Gossypium anomalum]|uniref:4Fe-4S ferredoxin-type domain-containing protein n=1 Tax=Gossypium anomalum TaxID=47600 RepID=A0A8J6D7M4_9ROSI|nr:hypothetical protein CXB51_006649 [Gossypium anomalum]
MRFMTWFKQEKETNIKLFIDIHDMFPMVTGFMNYGHQTVRAARYIGQGFMITLSHANRLPLTIQYPCEKLITSEHFCRRIHFEFDKCIACEVCVRVCPIDLPVVDWKFETDIRKKRLLNYSIDFGIKRAKIKLPCSCKDSNIKSPHNKPLPFEPIGSFYYGITNNLI